VLETLDPKALVNTDRLLDLIAEFHRRPILAAKAGPNGAGETTFSHNPSESLARLNPPCSSTPALVSGSG